MREAKKCVKIITTRQILNLSSKSRQRKIAVWVSKKPDILGLFAGDIFFISTLWRSRRDLNSRAGYPTYALSRGASSPLEYYSEC